MTEKVHNIKIIMTRLWLLVVVGLSLSSGMAFASNAAQEVKKIPDQPYGEYLAGLHAAIHNDLAAAANFHEQALALDPENRMILSKSFTIFIADGRYDLALSAAHKLDEAKASDSIVQMFLFLEDMKSGAYDVSLGRLDNIGSAGVYGLFKPLFQAWVFQSQGKVTEAEANISKMLEDKSFKEFKQFHAGLFYDYIGKTQLAEKMYAASLVIPGAMSLRTVEAYGILLRRLGRTDDAQQLYLNYLEKAPDNAVLKRALSDLQKGTRAELYVASEMDAIAEIFYTAANFLMQDNIRRSATAYLRFANYMRNDFPNADYLLGQIFETDQYFSGALDCFGRIDRNHPLYFNAQLQMAWVLEKMGQLDDAIDAMHLLLKTFPDNKEVLASLGDINRMNSRFEAAGKSYTLYIDGLIEHKDKHWSIFYTRGIVYEQLKKWKMAEDDFLKALELRPDQPQVLNYLAYSWVDRGLHIEKARKMLERAVELRPYDGYIIDSLGWALYRIGDMPKAVEYLEKAVLLQTDDWAINDHLGDAYWAVGRKYEARFQWRHALSLKPDEELVAKIKTKIKNGN